SLLASEYPTSEATFASRLAPTDYATKPLWELACKRIPHIRGRIRQQAGSHSLRYEASVGACLQANTPIRGHIRQQAGSHRLRYEAAVGACLQANTPHQR